MVYGIKNKENELFFGGFNADHSVKWVEKEIAYVMDHLTAKAQAALLICNGEPAQRKMVAV